MEINPVSPETHKVLVVDLGFSNAKWKFGERYGREKSAFSRQDDTYIIGEEALYAAGSRYLKTPEELVKYYPHFVKHIMQVAGVSPEDRIILSIGLPYKFWKDEMQKPETEVSAISQLQQVLTKNQIEAVTVLPQGLGGLKTYLAGRQEDGDNLLAIDIGFNTIIATLYSPRQQKTIFDGTFYKMGVHQMAVDQLLPKIGHLFPGRTLSPVELSYLLETGFVQHGFQRHPITAEINEAAQAYANDALGNILGELQAHRGAAATFSEVVFFGGGARLFSEINSKMVKVTVLDEPEYANARGFELMALQQFGRG